MDMKYIDVKTAGERWGITTRRVRILCNDGRIDGAVRNGWSWVIPADTPRPKDGRVLRRFKPLDVRLGTIDVDALGKMKSIISPAEYFGKEYSLQQTAHTISFLFALSGASIDESDVYRVLNGELVSSLTLDEHLIIVNFHALLENEKNREGLWGKGELEELYSSLTRGIKNKERLSLDKEAEASILHQYETGWSSLHPLSSALLVSLELMKEGENNKYRAFFYYLVFAGDLMRGGFIPPSLSSDSLEEAKAAYSLISSRGVYNDMMAFTERMLEKTYREIERYV